MEKHLLATGLLPSDIVVVMEATGTYWTELATFLDSRGFPLSVINCAGSFTMPPCKNAATLTECVARILTIMIRPTNQLPSIKEVRLDLESAHTQLLQDALKRVDKAFKGFFNRVKSGVKAGFPRFQGKNRYDSFCYPQGEWSIQNNRLTLSKLGTFKLKLHRPVAGKVKTCTIKREGLNWFVVFSVEYEFEPPVHKGEVVGIDVGLEQFAKLSNGEPSFL